MVVGQKVRHKGIGLRLLVAAIERTKGLGKLCRIELIVTPWNEAAIHLYSSVGFEKEGLLRKAAKFRAEPHDMVLMSLVW
jgi:putative acetyltransferase